MSIFRVSERKLGSKLWAMKEKVSDPCPPSPMYALYTYLQRFKVRKANGVKGTIFLPHVFHIVHYALMPVICRVAEIIST